MACTFKDCTAPALFGGRFCAGHLLIAGVRGFVGGLDGPAGRIANTVLDELGDTAAAHINQVASRSSGCPDGQAEVKGLELLRSLGFHPAGKAPTLEEVEAFRRRMARTFHPDALKGEPVNPELLTRINAACDAVKASILSAEPHPRASNSQKKRRPS